MIFPKIDNVQQKLGKLQDDRSEVMIETLGSLLKKIIRWRENLEP